MAQGNAEGLLDPLLYNQLAMKKIVIIGWPASGKSTFSETLAHLMNIPVYHLDALYWKPGHIAISNEDWIKLQYRMISGEYWIVEGNYRTTLNIRLSAADSIIFFDMPMSVCLRNAIIRMIRHYGRERIGMSAGNSERLDRHFLMRLMRIFWIYPALERGETIRLVKSLGVEKNVLIFRNYRETVKFIKEVGSLSNRLKGS